MSVALRSFVLCAATVLFSCEDGVTASQVAARPAANSCAAGATGPFKVANVSDGDTISVRIAGGKPTIVRLIGVDAPEIAGPYRNEEPHGVAARDFTRELLDDRLVFLESDPQQESHDRYGRMLAYVHRADDCLLVNGEIIRQGHAESYRRFRFRHHSLFARHEQEARINRRGMWSEPSNRKGRSP